MTKKALRMLVFFAPSLMVGITVCALYLPMLWHEPVLDDASQIAYIKSFSSWTDCFLLDKVGWFRPFKNFVFYFTVSAEDGVFYTKLACLSIFVFNIQLLYLLLNLLLRSGIWAFVGIGLFAFNPTMVSSVQFLSASNNQLALTFIILYLYLSIRYVDTARFNDNLRKGRFVLFAAMFALAMAFVGYEAAITATGVFFVLSVALYGWQDALRGKQLVVLCFSVVLTLAYLFIRYQTPAVNVFVSPSLPPGLSSVDLVLRAPYYTWAHFLLWIEPWGRGGVFIDDDPRGHFWLGILSWGGLAAVAACLLYGLQTRIRLFAAGGLIFLGGMLPLANFLALANGPICNYYLLIPSIGLVLALTALCQHLFISFSSTPQWFMVGGLVVLLCSFSLEARARVFYWKNFDSLMELTLQNYPENYFGLRYRGSVLFEEGDLLEGMKLTQKALVIAPWYGVAADYYAFILAATGQRAEAIHLLELYCREQESKPWKVLMRLGELYVQDERYKDASRVMAQLLPRNVPAGENVRLYVSLVIPCLLHYDRTDEALKILNLIEAECEAEGSHWKKAHQVLEQRAREDTIPAL